MRKNRFHISVICFLSIGLLFNQVGLNFFHNKHDAHESYAVQSDQDQFHSHGEHCKVCAVDTLFHLYFEASPEFHFQQAVDGAYSSPVLAKVITSSDFTKGRAPPFSV